jgi:hypothetical protein
MKYELEKRGIKSKTIWTAAASGVVALSALGITPFANANEIRALPEHSFSVFTLSPGLKNGYLNRACRSNLLTELMYGSYDKYIFGTESDFSDQYWERLNDDGTNVVSHNNRWIRWLNKKLSTFPPKARKATKNLAKALKAENGYVADLLNSSTIEEVQYNWGIYDRNKLSAGTYSGKIRKALGLPTRQGDGGCP